MTKFTQGIRKFAFAVFALTVGTVTTFLLKFEGTVYIQIFAVVTTGYLVSQAVVDIKKGE